MLHVSVVGTEERASGAMGTSFTEYVLQCESRTARAPGRPGISASTDSSVWVIRKRFSEFERLRRDLAFIGQNKDVPVELGGGAPFPEKRMVGSLWQKTVAGRRGQLQSWLRAAIEEVNAVADGRRTAQWLLNDFVHLKGKIHRVDPKFAS